MDKLLRQRKPLIITTLVVCLAVLAGGWFLLVSPQRAKVEDLRAQVATQESANTSLRSQISALQALAAKLPQQRASLAAISAKVPDKPALPDLVRALSQAADKAGVQLTGITPSALAAVTGAAGLSSIDVTLTVQGDYVALEQYELALEDLSRAFLVSGLSIDGGSAGSGGAGSSGAPAATPSASSSGTSLTGKISGRVLLGQLADSAASSSPGASTAGTS